MENRKSIAARTCNYTHEQLVEFANEIFSHIKHRYELLAMERKGRPLSDSDEAELLDFSKDVQVMLYIEGLGIGKAGNGDCFAIADVLLRAIYRQWTECDVVMDAISTCEPN